MKISLIITVLNEEKTILLLLEALRQQTRRANEIIIADGGSQDKTQLILTQFGQEHPDMRLRLIQKKGNRSMGRNAAITVAKHTWIAITDAGCVPHQDWLAELERVAEAGAHQQQTEFVVAGYYDAQPQTPFEEAVVPYVLVMPDRVDPQHFLPATRSMLLTKTVWEKFGGFDELLNDNEDYSFARKIADKKIQIYFAENARVSWIPRHTLGQFLGMIFRFARGDATAGLFRIKMALIFLRYIGGLIGFLVLAKILGWPFALLIAVIGAGIYALWAIWKNKKYVPNGWYWLPVLQVTSDVTVMVGSLVGTLRLAQQ